MIKQLRLKIIFIITIIFSVLLLITLVSTCTTSAQSLRKTTHTNLMTIINYTYSSKVALPQNTSSPVAVVTVDYQSHIKLLVNQMTRFSNDEVINLTKKVLNGHSSSGYFPTNIRYLRRTIGISDIRIAFADCTVEEQIINRQIQNSICIGIVAFIAFFILSIYISKWIAIPVERASESQKQFIADASHELKTPLTVILTNSELIRSSKDTISTENLNRICNITDEAKQMHILIEDMLQITKYECASFHFTHSVFNFSDLVMQRSMLYEPVFFESGKTLHLDVTPNITLNGSEYQLRQLLDILLDNAAKYGNPNTEIKVTLLRNAKKQPLLSVQSIGRPLSKDEGKRIFERFYRVDPSRTTSSGYGLGLYIASTIVNEHSAKIWVISDANSNTFNILF